MDETDSNMSEQVRRSLLAHARMLRGAGVEWMAPASPPMSVQAPAGISAGEVENGPEAKNPLAGQNAAQAINLDTHADHLEILAPEVPGEAGGGTTLDERRAALQVLAAEVKTCTRCAELCSTRTQTVFGQGEPGVEVCFVGEAPGADEDAQGLPFVGAAGQLLNRIIAACGWRREEVYICNILKCRPPGNRTPLPNEAANCRDYLERQLQLVQPKHIVALGSSAAGNLLNSKLALSKLRGRFHEWRGIPVMVTYHPAFLLPHRSPEKKRDVWEDMKTLLARMGRPVPGQGSSSS